MYELIYYIKEFGSVSLDVIWFPVLIWTICSAAAFLFLKSRDKLNPLFHYHLRTAALLSLPLGIFTSYLLSKIPTWLASSNFETAFFVVQNPIELVSGSNSQTAESITVNWLEPSFIIGVITFLIAMISLFMIGKLIHNYLALKTLHKNLSLINLKEIALYDYQINKTSIKLAFYDHPFVPFTFGWKNPVIVLPMILQNDPEKMEMALQHELIHVKRGDYLLQLALSLIESLFWFHPLIRYGNREIDTYREISCDQEVLSKSNFSIQSYANLLYELIPLSAGTSRLSVSMAVKNSTLKKRIKTMKYHKLHKASFRQSIAFLLLMVIGITLPIACSDLRGPEAVSNEQLEQTHIQIQEPSVTINGIEIDTKNAREVKTSALGAVQIITSEYGLFKVAPRQFEGGIQAGKIDGNSISFEFNELNVVLNSSSEIIPGISSTPVWVSHIQNVKADGFMLFPMENANAQMPPPPPTAKEDEEDLRDYFVVVEQMPKLIGGMKALQSKVEYTEMARRAGIEGRVTVQFIVNENGDVEKAEVVRGIGGGLDESALAAVKEATFEPGMQKGQPVRVRYALSVNFRLEDSDFSSGENSISQEQGSGLN